MGKKKEKTNPMDELIEKLDEIVDPKNMSKEEYRDFLEELIGDLKVRLEAVEMELEEEG
jgi:polyhydroxyalkanoate synthesis regulator phasin